MIALEMVEEIKRLLAKGELSQRAIARLTGISRGTVNAIAQGKRRQPRCVKQADDDEEEDTPSGPPQRCPGCGGFVYMPCRLCKVRAAMATSSLPRSKDGATEPMRVELTVEQWKRYRPFFIRRLQLAAAQTSSPAEVNSHEV